MGNILFRQNEKEISKIPLQERMKQYKNNFPAKLHRYIAIKVKCNDNSQIPEGLSKQLFIKFNPTLIYETLWGCHLIYGNDYDLNKKSQKFITTIASYASVCFPKILFEVICYNLDSPWNVMDYLSWRFDDNINRSVINLAKKHLKNINNQKQILIDLLLREGVDWEKLSEHEKYGTFISITYIEIVREEQKFIRSQFCKETFTRHEFRGGNLYQLIQGYEPSLARVSADYPTRRIMSSPDSY